MAAAIASLPAELPAVLVLIATALVTYGERRVHGYNYAYLKVVGGEELIPEQMRRYYQIQQALPWIAWLTHFFLPGFMRWTAIPIVGLTLLMTSLLLRIWSMRSLGRLWPTAVYLFPACRDRIRGPIVSCVTLNMPRTPSRASGFCSFLGRIPWFCAFGFGIQTTPPESAKSSPVSFMSFRLLRCKCRKPRVQSEPLISTPREVS